MSTFRPTLRETFRSSGVGGGVASALVFHALTPDDTSFELLGVKIGIGGLTEARTSSIFTPDHENIYREFVSGEPGWSGGRVVRNLSINSDDLSSCQLVRVVVDATNVSDPLGNNNAVTLRNTESGTAVCRIAGILPRRGTASLWIRSVTDIGGSVHVLTGGVNSPALPLTGIWQRFSFTSDGGGAFNAAGVSFTGGVGTVIDVFGLQAELIDGSTNENPSEYVSTVALPLQKTFANLNGNTVTSNVVTEAVGAALAEAPYLYVAPAATNSQIFSDDAANAEWTKSNITAAKDAIGLTGVANGASTLTATAANGTCIANIITASSDDQTARFFLQRKTGTGTIEITVDGGSTWVDITTALDAASDWYEAITAQAALTDPQVGVRIVTSGDAVLMGSGECHLSQTEAEIRGSSPIFTSGSTVTVDATDLSFISSNVSVTDSTWFFEGVMFGDAATGLLDVRIHTSLGQSFPLLADISAFDKLNVILDGLGTDANVTSVANYVTGAPFKAASYYYGSASRVNENGNYGTEAAGFTGFNFNSFKLASIGVALIRNLRRNEDGDKTAAEITIDGLMA